MPTTNQTFVIALGGSIFYPDEIDVAYLKEFYDFIIEEIATGKKFIIVTGGGSLCRKFQKAAGQIAKVSNEDKDWLGIHTTRVNAHLLRTIFVKEAHPVILKRRGKVENFDGHSIIIGAGWHPGWSTDFVAVQIAIDFKAGQAIILGKPEYVFDKDPSSAPPSLELRRASKTTEGKQQKFSEAKPIEKISWSDYLKLVPNNWSPGLHAPVDPIAAKLAQKEKLKVIVAGGRDLSNVRNILECKKFKGTTITD